MPRTGLRTCPLEIISQRVLVSGMCDAYHRASPLTRAFTAQIGDAVFGDDDLSVVFGMIDMAYEWHDSANRAAFSERWAQKQRQISVASEVAATADTIFHLRTHDVSGVYVAVDICL